MSEMLRRPRAASAPEPFPPPDMMPFLKKKSGSHKVVKQFETELTAHRVPDVIPTLQALGRMLTYDSSYEAKLQASLRGEHGVRLANVDHLANPAPLYLRHGVNSYQNRYRQGVGLRVEMAIPLHNVATLLRLDSGMPDDDVMLERAKEQQAVTHLYRIGKTALWLEEMRLHGTQTYRTAENYVLQRGYGGHYPKAQAHLPSFAMLLDRLEGSGPSRHGILPNIEHLSQLTLQDAVAELAIWGGNDVIMTAEESTAIIMEASRKATGFDLAA